LISLQVGIVAPLPFYYYFIISFPDFYINSKNVAKNKGILAENLYKLIATLLNLLVA